MPGDPFYTSRQWLALRMKVLALARFQCQHCGQNVRGKGNARVDHIQPRKIRPDLELNAINLRVLCVSCDAKRHREKGGQGKSIEKIEHDANGYPINSEWAK